MEIGNQPSCPHGNWRPLCFECLSPADQRRSREAWERLALEAPDLHERIQRSRDEIAAGKVIRMERKSGRAVVIPHSVFREMVDFLHEKKKGERDNA